MTKILFRVLLLAARDYHKSKALALEAALALEDAGGIQVCLAVTSQLCRPITRRPLYLQISMTTHFVTHFQYFAYMEP